MRTALTILFIVLFHIPVSSQTKVYFSAGKSVSHLILISDFFVFGKGLQVRRTENRYDTKGISNFWTSELFIETRLNKVINGVTGISVFKMGYDNSATFNNPIIGDFHSKLDITSIAIPFIFRANIANAVMFDMGITVNLPISANLDETRNIGTTFEQHHEGKITSSLVSNYPGVLGRYLGFTVLINRFMLTASWQASQIIVDKKLLDTWPIGNGSMFLTDIYPKFSYETIHLKLGVRLK